MQRAHALLGRAFEHLRCQRHAVASSHAVDAREDFLRIKRHVAPLEVALAAAAAFARGGGAFFAEVAQDEGAQAFGRVAVVGHLLQAAEFVCLARGILGRDVDQVLLRHDVLRREEQDAFARLAVASRASRLLIVRLDVFRHVVVDDEAHVRLVDAHAEGVRRDDRLHVVVEEVVLRLRALFVAESRMVGTHSEFFLLQEAAQGVRLLARRTVDDAGFFAMRAQVVRDEVLAVDAREDAEEEVRPVEARDVHGGAAKREERDDVVLDARRRRRREGADQGALRQTFDEGRDGAIARAEVVPPLRQAVRLVDGDEGNGLLLQQGLEEVGFEPLGRDIDDFVRASRDGAEPCASFRLSKRAVDECRGRTGFRERVDLILHQRDQGRDDECDTREQQGGHLEADGLSRARGHDGDGLAAFEQALDDGLLRRAEALVAEGLL